MTFEQFAQNYKIRIFHISTGNGIFVDNTIINDDRAQQKSNSYCGVNAHHQNG